MSGSRKRGSWRHDVNSDLNLMPLMNIIIVLIPMLLLSAVFIDIRAIDMSSPQALVPAQQPADAPLDVAVLIADGAYVVAVDGQPVRTVPRPGGTAGAGAPGEAATTALTQALSEVAAQHPDTHDVRIVAGPTIRYEEIVALIDIARAAGLPQAALEGSGTET